MITHLANGCFMNWAGAQKGEGFEYHILAVALALVVMLRGQRCRVRGPRAVGLSARGRARTMTCPLCA